MHGGKHLLVRMYIIIWTGLKIATGTVAKATKISSVATKNSPFKSRQLGEFISE